MHLPLSCSETQSHLLITSFCKFHYQFWGKALVHSPFLGGKVILSFIFEDGNPFGFLWTFFFLKELISILVVVVVVVVIVSLKSSVLIMQEQRLSSCRPDFILGLSLHRCLIFLSMSFPCWQIRNNKAHLLNC